MEADLIGRERYGAGGQFIRNTIGRVVAPAGISHCEGARRNRDNLNGGAGGWFINRRHCMVRAQLAQDVALRVVCEIRAVALPLPEDIPIRRSSSCRQRDEWSHCIRGDERRRAGCLAVPVRRIN